MHNLLLPSPKTQVPPHQIIHCMVLFPMPDLSVSEVMVFNCLGKLDVTKSKRPDSAHPHPLKECRKALSYPLCMLLQISLQNGELQYDWKTSCITQIHKKEQTKLCRKL